MTPSSSTLVIITHDQASRLALTLRSLVGQTRAPDQIVVVDDASSDDTAEVVERLRPDLARSEVRYLRNAVSRGSAGARNVGAAAARGDVLLFLDGDAVAAPDHVGRHLGRQRALGGALLYGSMWSTPRTEYLADPSRPVLFDVPIAEDRRRELLATASEATIGEDEVALDFDSVVARAEPGGYPGVGYMETEGERIEPLPDHPAAWVLITPQNLSVPRSVFEAVGGFDEGLGFSEGWDFALRVRAAGHRIARLGTARTYHLYHYRPFGSFAEELKRWLALRRIAAKQRRRSVLLASLFFRLQGGDPWLPEELRPFDLDALARAMEDARGDDLGHYDVILRGHPVLSQLEAGVDEMEGTWTEQLRGDGARVEAGR